MNTMPFESPLSLARGQVVRLGALRGARLECRRGAVWLTFDHDRRDLVLEAGQELRVDSRRPVLVTALGGQATVGVCAPA